MALENDYDRQQIVKLSEYRKLTLVVTEGIEVISSDQYTYFSRPGGKEINFIEDRVEELYDWHPGTYGIFLFKTHYYMEHYFNGVTIEYAHCACKLAGERCP